MSVFIIAPDPKSERVAVLLRTCKKAERPASVVADLDAARAVRGHGAEPDSVVIIPDPDGHGGGLELAMALLQAGRLNAFIVYVAASIPAETYKRLLRTERGDWIQWENLAQELPELFSRIALTAASARAGKVVSLVPSKGGVGNSTLAVELGIYFASAKKKPSRLAVVDLNFQGSTLADGLDLESRLDVSEFISRPERLDGQLIEIFASRHRTGLDIFSSPPLFIDLAPLNQQALFSLLDGLGKTYDMIVIDLPRQWFPWVDNILQGSDAVVIVGGTTVPAVRQLAGRLEHVEALSIEPERIGVVFNQCETNALGRVKHTSDIDRAFQGRRLFYVPRDVRTATEAANTGRAMAEIAPRRPVSKSIRPIGDWLKGMK